MQPFVKYKWNVPDYWIILKLISTWIWVSVFPVLKCEKADILSGVVHRSFRALEGSMHHHQEAASKIWTATYLWGIIVCVCIISGPLAWRSQDRKNWMLKTVSCSLSLLLMLLFLVFGVIFSTFTLSWTISCLNPLFCHLYVQHHHCTLLFFLRGPHGNTSLCVAYEQPSTLWSQIPVQIQPQYHHLILPITADTTVLSQDESNNFFTLSLVWLLDKLCFTLLFG